MDIFQQKYISFSAFVQSRNVTAILRILSFFYVPFLVFSVFCNCHSACIQYSVFVSAILPRTLDLHVNLGAILESLLSFISLNSRRNHMNTLQRNRGILVFMFG